MRDTFFACIHVIIIFFCFEIDEFIQPSESVNITLSCTKQIANETHSTNINKSLKRRRRRRTKNYLQMEMKRRHTHCQMNNIEKTWQYSTRI